MEQWMCDGGWECKVQLLYLDSAAGWCAIAHLLKHYHVPAAGVVVAQIEIDTWPWQPGFKFSGFHHIGEHVGPAWANLPQKEVRTADQLKQAIFLDGVRAITAPHWSHTASVNGDVVCSVSEWSEWRTHWIQGFTNCLYCNIVVLTDVVMQCCWCTAQLSLPTIRRRVDTRGANAPSRLLGFH